MSYFNYCTELSFMIIKIADGCSCWSHYYPYRDGHYSSTDGISTDHFGSNKLCEVNICLDLEKNELKIYLVGGLSCDKKFRLWGFDKGLGWVPHFNLYHKKTELRIAEVPIEWYGEQKNDFQFQ